MIYLKSLIRRFRGKTAFYASVPLLLVGLTLLEDKRDAFLIFFSSTVLLYALAKLINKIDHKKKTGVTCKLCGFSDCSLLYPARRKKSPRKTLVVSLAPPSITLNTLTSTIVQNVEMVSLIS